MVHAARHGDPGGAGQTRTRPHNPGVQDGKGHGQTPHDYTDLGLTPAAARRQAVIAYAAYLGWLELRATGGDDLPEVARTGRRARAALDQLVETLLLPRG